MMASSILKTKFTPMKKIFVTAIAALMLAACNGKSESKTETVAADSAKGGVLAADAPKVKFEQEIYNFGAIQQGEKVSYAFKFKNEGKTPLVISNVSATCGCTTPETPNAPIKPGEEGTIKVVFDSAGKNGMQDKVITITSNANPEASQLHLVGEVKVK